MAGKNAAASILKTLLKPSSTPQSAAGKTLTQTVLSLLKANRLQKAVSILFASPESVPYSLYAHLFQLCSSSHAIVEARKVESHLVSFSPTPPIFLLNRAIECYGKCGNLNDARELFDEMPERDGGSWNAMLSAYTQNGFAGKAVELFLEMNSARVLGNEITYASVLGSSAGELELGLSRQIHGLIVKRGFCGNVILESSLVDVYGKCMVMSDARRMFDEIENKNAVSWNVIVRRYLEAGDEKESIVMFFKMLREDNCPLNFTFANALLACSLLSSLKEGMQIHGVVIKMDFVGDEVVLGSLIDMYVKCGKLEDACRIFYQPGKRDMISWTSIVSGYATNGRIREARELFNDMPERNVISWNAMLAGYTHSLQWEEALSFFNLMQETTKDIDHVTLGLLLNVCAGLPDVEMGKQVHGFIYRHGYSINVFVSNALLDMYCKCGNLRCARVWFYQMSGWRDKVSWNALLTSYARCGQSEQAMTFFSKMQWETTPSKFTFGTLLAACANMFALKQGKQIHCFMIRNGYEMDIVVRGALVDMYTKCNCLDYAIRVFKESSSWDVILCNSIIFGCCCNGRGKDALELFSLMKKEGIKPDHITFHGILLACICECHIKLGLQYFDLMSNEYGIIPQLEHYVCMIELYCQNGCMEELENFVKRIPFDPTVSLLTKIFRFCRKQGHTKLGEWAAKKLSKLDPSVQFQV
ncbi:putative Pentatricopeptide repeat-containing protein [Melia azedarach]|uniref:Pentatricopeptide repeat-containing protein n=1 Tax=Melia azedarach TaxID=155640 RepID=A0ACC1WP61_MELAZ|nr:putative Pentatricopeptide repeat-containing protein [Melia azedarach]